MPQSVTTFIGIFSLLLWLQTSDYLSLAFDTVVHNESVVVCLSFVVAMVGWTLIARCAKHMPSIRFYAIIAFATALCGALYGIYPNEQAHLVLFCIHTVGSALLLIAWGAMLAAQPEYRIIPIVCSAALLSTLILCLFCESAPSTIPLAACVCPLLAGCCLLLANMRADDEFTQQVNFHLLASTDSTQADLGPEYPPPPDTCPTALGESAEVTTDQEIEVDEERNHPPTSRKSLVACTRTMSSTGLQPHAATAVSLLVMLCLCTICASLFSGMATSPFLANSRSIMHEMLLVTLLMLAGIGTGGMVYLEGNAFQRILHPKSSENEVDEECREDALDASPRARRAHIVAEQQRALSYLLLVTTLTVVVLTIGLFLFSLQLSGTLVLSLALIFSAKNCLVALTWIVVPRSIADFKLPFFPCFVLLMLGSGTVYALCLGVWVGSIISFQFSTLINTAITALVFIVILLIICLMIRSRLSNDLVENAEQTSEYENHRNTQTQPPTIEEAQAALYDHRRQRLESYHLTEREKQIVMMMIDGQTMGGIAEQLFITERTVKFHAKNAYEKIGVHNKKELMQKFSELPADELVAL